MRPIKENSNDSLIQAYFISRPRFSQSIPFVFLYHFKLLHPKLDLTVTEISSSSTAWLCTCTDLDALIPSLFDEPESRNIML